MGFLRVRTDTTMTECSNCGHDYLWEDNFCAKCGERLPELPESIKKKKMFLLYLGVVGAFFIALPMLGAGIALWFMGPAWFHYTETYAIRTVSIGLMAGGPALFVMFLSLTAFVRVPETPETETDATNDNTESSGI